MSQVITPPQRHKHTRTLPVYAWPALVLIGVAVALMVFLPNWTARTPQAIPSGADTRYHAGSATQALEVQGTSAPSSQRAASGESRELTLDDVVAELPYHDQELALSFIGRFDSSAYAFSTSEEYAWMLSRGFPSPEEIVNAARLDIETLKTRAANGDAKAAYFLADRVMEEFPYDMGVSADIAWLNAETMTHLNRAMGASSPFAGYVLSSMARRSKGIHPIYELVGLQVAYELGDTRVQASAIEVGQRLMREAPDAGPFVALIAMHNQRMVAEMFDPMAFSPARKTTIPGH